MKNKQPEQCDSKMKSHQVIYSVDVHETGMSLGRHTLPADIDFRSTFGLRLTPYPGVPEELRSRYILSKQNPLHQLERHMMLLSERGLLRQSTVVLGLEQDPFLPFNGKFEKSMQFLELCKKYTPGLLHIQTRSPLIVIALPVFAKLGKHCSVSIGLETHLEDVSHRYTPELPRVSERIKTLRALKRFGVSTHVQASPVLPYGDWKNDAGEFAELLASVSDHILVQPFSDGTRSAEKRIRQTSVGRKLAEDRKFHYLRPDAASPLLSALSSFCPEKLEFARPSHMSARQLNLFAA